MVIKEGYKQTEIGVIPMDWEVKSYDEVFYFLNTATYSRAELTELDEIKYIHYGDIHTKFHFHLDVNNSYLPSIPQSKLKNYSLLKDGDIIMADASEDYLGIGKSIEIKNLGDKKIISGLHTFLFRDKNYYFINGYKGYIHSINVVKKQFDSLATGMKVYGVSKNNLKKILIPIPTLAEQTAIATALSDADGLITGLEKLIAKKRNIKQGAMQQLLQPKDGWEVKKLGEIALFYKGKGLPKSHINDNGKFKCIHYGELFTKHKEYIREVISYTSETVNLFYSITNDVLMPTSDVTPNGLATASCIKESGVILGGDVLVIRISEKILDGIFLSYFITKNREQVMKLVSGSTVYHLSGSDMKNLTVYFPLIEEQNRIVSILTDMDAELSALEQKLEKYKKVKLGMMQELLTGKTRLV